MRGRLAGVLVFGVTLLATSGSGPAADPAATGVPRVAGLVPGANGVLTPSPSHPRALQVVALGDSVTSGAACACAAFPAVYGRLLSRKSGVPVHVDNRGADGLDTAGLLQLLQQDTDGAARAVGDADVILVTIGANDFGDHHDEVTEGRCSRPAGGDCVSDELLGMRAGLDQILSTVRSLRGRRATTVLVTGYWNVFEDGDVARRSFPASGRAATLGLTRRTNQAVRLATLGQGATYVGVLGPFHRDRPDISGLLAADGDHPNAMGHALLARVLLHAGLPPLVAR